LNDVLVRSRLFGAEGLHGGDFGDASGGKPGGGDDHDGYGGWRSRRRWGRAGLARRADSLRVQVELRETGMPMASPETRRTGALAQDQPEQGGGLHAEGEDGEAVRRFGRDDEIWWG
jgi:hypothetical protein